MAGCDADADADADAGADVDETVWGQDVLRAAERSLSLTPYPRPCASPSLIFSVVVVLLPPYCPNTRRQYVCLHDCN